MFSHWTPVKWVYGFHELIHELHELVHEFQKCSSIFDSRTSIYSWISWNSRTSLRIFERVREYRRMVHECQEGFMKNVMKFKIYLKLDNWEIFNVSDFMNWIFMNQNLQTELGNKINRNTFTVICLVVIAHCFN